MASYTAYLFSMLMLNGLVENVSFYLVLLLLLLAFYGMAGGIEGGQECTRYCSVSDDTAVSDVICGMQEVKPVHRARFCGGWKRSVKRQLLCAFLLFHGVDRTVPERICCDRKKMRWRSRKAVWFSGGVFTAPPDPVGLFGVEALAQMKFPAVTMMSRDAGDGRILRTDAFMFSIWFLRCMRC